MERGRAVSPAIAADFTAAEGRGWIHRARPGAHLAASLPLFITGRRQHREQGLGCQEWGFSQLGRAVARHKHTNITAEMHPKPAAGGEQQAQEESTPQNMGPANGCRVGTGWFLPT